MNSGNSYTGQGLAILLSCLIFPKYSLPFLVENRSNTIFWCKNIQILFYRRKISQNGPNTVHREDHKYRFTIRKYFKYSFTTYKMSQYHFTAIPAPLHSGAKLASPPPVY